MNKFLVYFVFAIFVVASIIPIYYLSALNQSNDESNIIDKPIYDYPTTPPIIDDESFNDGERYLDFEFSSSYDPTITGVRATYIIDGWATDYYEPINLLKINTASSDWSLNDEIWPGYWSIDWVRDGRLWIDMEAGITYDFAFGAPIMIVNDYANLRSTDLIIGEHDYDVSLMYYHIHSEDSRIWDFYTQYIDTFSFCYMDNTHNNLIYKLTIVGGSNEEI